MAATIEEIVDKVCDVLGRPDRIAPLHEPVFSGREWDYVKECIDTSWVSSVGSYVERFANALASYCGARAAVPLVNGTAALHLGLHLLDVQRGDLVIAPSMSFVATANAIAYTGADPLFADIEASTLSLDPSSIEGWLLEHAEPSRDGCRCKRDGRRIAAIVPMHTFGFPARLDDLVELSDKFGIPLLEDAAESLGSTYRDRHTGTWGRLGALSFNGNKVITTGGGGALLTNDMALAARASHLSQTAKVPHPWEFNHDEVGFNYRMPNLNAALGCAQLEQLDRFLERKRSLAQRYIRAFDGVAGVEVVRETPNSRANYWLNTLVLDKELASERDALLAALHAARIGARPVWTALHRLPMFRRCPKMDLPVTESMAGRIVNLPSGVPACPPSDASV